MANRRLTDKERNEIAAPILEKVRAAISASCDQDKDLAWAVRRYVYIRLMHDERGSSSSRQALKRRKWKDQEGLCAACGKGLPERGFVLDRFKAMDGYTPANTQLLCLECDAMKQEQNKFA